MYRCTLENKRVGSRSAGRSLKQTVAETTQCDLKAKVSSIEQFNPVIN